jgi:hypothetical protein
LAMGDPVFANERFMTTHLQDNFYLKSRECAVAEDMIRAVKNRDQDALDEIRTSNRPHQTAIANLSPALQAVVAGLRTTGVARLERGGGTTKSAATATATDTKGAVTAYDEDDVPTTSLNELLNAKTGYEGAADGKQQTVDNAAELGAELDALDFGDDDDDDDDDLDDDDDVDLR